MAAPKTATALMALALISCPSRNTLATLTLTMGGACATLAQLQGNADLAKQISDHTQLAVSAINNWKPGSPSEQVVQALNVVVDDLNLICGPRGVCDYQPLINLALGTIAQIIQVVGGPPDAVHTKVRLTQAPTDAKTFQQDWDAVRRSSPDMAKAPVL